MNYIYSSTFTKWALRMARVLFGIFFLFAATSKIPGTAMFLGNVQASAQIGLPFPTVLVTLAFIFEMLVGLALVFGWYARIAAFVAIFYIGLLAVLFHRDFSNPMELGFFIDHLTLMTGLLLASATVSDKKLIK